MRLIDCDALENEICSGCDYYKNKYANCDDCAIAHAPTVDAEAVVRCKDCRHGETMKTKLAGRITAVFCHKYKHERFMTGSDYCSYGERREP